VTHAAMKDIYDRLKPLGFTPTFVRSCILPDWWEDKLAEVPSNRQHAEALIARHLKIEAATLRDHQATLKVRNLAPLKLKLRQGTSESEVHATSILGERLARIVDSSLETPMSVSGLTASSIRERILESGAKWVGFHELLHFCWSIGIPVLNLCRVPTGNKKPDGMAVWPGKRPIIIIASGRKHPAWHVFYIAHELGHIVLGHLSQGELNIDTRIRLDSDEDQEEEANAFAVKLLSGRSNLLFTPYPRRMNARQLADTALSIGKEFNIDPGFVALSYSRSRNFYKVAQAALPLIQREADAWQLYSRSYVNLDSDALTEDNRHVFERLTKAA
jgi:Zn-dependent peptidase ImmA (M78 family)